jgi:hypothetical protein
MHDRELHDLAEELVKRYKLQPLLSDSILGNLMNDAEVVYPGIKEQFPEELMNALKIARNQLIERYQKALVTKARRPK